MNYLKSASGDDQTVTGSVADAVVTILVKDEL